MDFKDVMDMTRDEQFYLMKAQGLSDDEAGTAIILLEKGLITTRQPVGDGSAEAVTHEDRANQEKMRAKEGNAKTVPASESNKGPAPYMDDEKDEEEDPDADADGDGAPDDEEYPDPRLARKAKKSFGVDEYSDEALDALAKAAGPDISRQFDGSVALAAMRDTHSDLYGQLAYEVYTLKSLVEELSGTLRSELKIVKSKIVDSHNKQVTYLHETVAKSLAEQKEEIGAIAKSLTETPDAAAATGVVTRLNVGGEKPLGKSHGVELVADDLAGAKLEISEQLYKAMTNPELTSDASAALSRLDRIKTQAQFDNFLTSRNPALFAGK